MNDLGSKLGEAVANMAGFILVVGILAGIVMGGVGFIVLPWLYHHISMAWN